MEVGLSHGHRDHGGRWLNLQTLGPHSQLQGWMGPGHLLFNSPGSPRGTFSDWDFSESSEKRWESPQLGLAPGGPRGGCLWTCVPHTLQLFLSTQTAWQSSWNFLLRGLLPWPRARPTCSPKSRSLRMVQGFSSDTHLCPGAPQSPS